MWIVHGHELSMAEGDYGLQLPVTISGPEFTENDTIKITFKTGKNGTELLVKEYTPVDGSVDLELTAQESELFPVGTYVYSIDWYQSGKFMCNLITVATFKVVDKA